MENNHSDTERIEWLINGGMERFIVKKLGLTNHHPSYEYRIRLNVGSMEEQWRYSEPFGDLRAAIDFGIENPLTK